MSYIKIDRKIVDWEWFSDGNMLRLWLYILVNANYKDKKWKGNDIPKGSLITSREHLAKNLHMSQQTIRTCLTRLKSTNEITIKTTNKYTQIYVNKWEEYQCCNDDTNQQINQQTNNQLTNNQPTTNQQLTTTKESKEYKERKERKNIYKYPHNDTPIYDDSQNIDVDISELEIFRKEFK